MVTLPGCNSIFIRFRPFYYSPFGSLVVTRKQYHKSTSDCYHISFYSSLNFLRGLPFWSFLTSSSSAIPRHTTVVFCPSPLLVNICSALLNIKHLSSSWLSCATILFHPLEYLPPGCHSRCSHSQSNSYDIFNVNVPRISYRKSTPD